MTLRIWPALGLVLLFVNAATARDWPQFRGAQGMAVAVAKDLPSTWSQEGGLRWKAELPGRGLSCPVIFKDRAYVTCSSGIRQDRLHVLCFNVKDGKKIWERQFWATGSTQCNPKTCMAAPTPAADDEGIYALFATGDLVALDHVGNLLWLRALCKDYPTITNQVGMAASPIVYKDVVIVPMENAGESFVAGLDRATGVNRWRAERTKDINWVTPVLFPMPDRVDVVFQMTDDVTAFDPLTGAKRWSLASKGRSSAASPIVANGLLLSAGGDCLALRPSTGTSQPEVVWQSNKLRTSYSSFLYYDGHVYAMTGAILHCVDANEGKPVWQQRLEGAFSASPIAADGKVYAVNEAGTTFVVETGKEPKLVSKNDLGEPMLATPAIADNAIFLRSDKHLYCVGKK